MSWDLFIMRLPKGLKKIEDMAGEFDAALGLSRSGVMKKLWAIAPGFSVDEFGIGAIKAEGGSIEVGVGTNDPVDTVMLSVRGGGRPVVELTCTIVNALGGRAIDAANDTGLFDPARAIASFERFRAYRDRALRPRKKKAIKPATKTGTKAPKRVVKKAGVRPAKKPRR